MHRLLFIIVIGLLAFRLPGVVFAETLRQEEIMKGATPPPATDKKDPIYKGMTSVASTKFGQGKAFEILAGTIVGFELQDLIIPWFGGKDKTISNPDIEPMKVLHEAAAPWTLPQQAIEKIVDYTEDNTLTTRFCAVQTNKSSTGGHIRWDVESTGNQESGNIEHTQELFQNARLINSMWGRQFVMPDTAGRLDMNLAPEIFGAPTVLGFCDWHYDSELKEPVERDVVKLSTFGTGGGGVVFTVTQTIIDHVEQVLNKFGELVEKIFYAKDTAALEARVTEVSHDSNFHQLGNIGDMTAKELEKAPYDWTKMLETTRGWTFNFLPEAWAAKAHKHAGGSEYAYGVNGVDLGDGGNVFENKEGEIQHPWPGVENASFRIDDALCSLIPIQLQKNAAYGTDENYEKLNCDEGTTSNLENAIACTPEGASTELTGSPESAVQSAAASVGIPQCVLHGIASTEGAYIVDSCDVNECGAKGPFSITIGYTYKEENGQCTKDTECKSCGAGYCPNTLGESSVLSGYTEEDLCNFDTAAEAAAKLVQSKASAFGGNLSGTNADVTIGNTALLQAIIDGGNAYFGSSHVFTSGNAIVPGCSYGESIVKRYCGVEAYVCGTLNRPVNTGGSNEQLL